MKLYYKEFLVGTIADVFESEGTWWGKFSQSTSAAEIRELERVLVFIQFCKNWNLRHASDCPPEASEFDAYADVCQTESWVVVDTEQIKRQVEHSPNFLHEGNDISWTEVADG